MRLRDEEGIWWPINSKAHSIHNMILYNLFLLILVIKGDIKNQRCINFTNLIKIKNFKYQEWRCFISNSFWISQIIMRIFHFCNILFDMLLSFKKQLRFHLNYLLFTLILKTNTINELLKYSINVTDTLYTTRWLKSVAFIHFRNNVNTVSRP